MFFFMKLPHFDVPDYLTFQSLIQDFKSFFPVDVRVNEMFRLLTSPWHSVMTDNLKLHY